MSENKEEIRYILKFYLI